MGRAWASSSPACCWRSSAPPRRPSPARQVRGQPDGGFISHLPTGIGDVTLLAITLGAICANALNVYSGSMSFLALGIKLPLHAAPGHRGARLRRGRLLGRAGRASATRARSTTTSCSSSRTGSARGSACSSSTSGCGGAIGSTACSSTSKHNPWAGAVAMAVADGSCRSSCSPTRPSTSASSPSTSPKFGDLTFEVGFVLAAVLYALFFRLQGEARRTRYWRSPARGLNAAGRTAARLSEASEPQEGHRLLDAVPDHGGAGRRRPGRRPARRAAPGSVARPASARRRSDGASKTTRSAGPPIAQPVVGNPERRSRVRRHHLHSGPARGAATCGRCAPARTPPAPDRRTQRVPRVHHRVVADRDVDAGGQQLLDPGRARGVPARRRSGPAAPSCRAGWSPCAARPARCCVISRLA